MSRIWTPWTRQPQIPVGIDWSNPITRGLRFAFIPTQGLLNLVNGQRALNITGGNPRTVSTSGILSDPAAAAYAEFSPNGLDASGNNLTVLSIWRAKSSQYASGDNTRILLSTRTAGNAGWSYGRVSAIAGGGLGNLTAQTFIVQGVAQYSEANYVIPSLADTPVCLRVSGTTASWYAVSGKSSPDTTVGTVTNGGNIVLFAGGPYSAINSAWNDRANIVLAFSRTLSDVEISSLISNSWQIFQPLQRRIYVDMGAGSGGSPYTFNAETGDFAITGSAATLAATRTLSADTGSYSITGQSATLSAGKSLNAAPGSFNITGQESTLVASRVLAANSGSITISGTDATLDYSGSGATLDASAGSFALTGANASLLRTYAFNAETGALVITGSNATLSYSGSSATTLTAADLAAIAALIPTVEQIAAAVLAVSVETGATVAESLRLSNAVLGGKVSGAGTGTETFRNPADTKDRLVVTVDSSGNRTAITLDLD